MSRYSGVVGLALRTAEAVHRRADAWKLDQDYAQQAEHAFEKICAHSGRRPERGQLDRAEAWARDVLGSERFAPWLRAHTAWTGEFKEGWIPNNFYRRIVLPAIQGRVQRLASFKTLARRLMNTDLMPDVAYLVKGNWLDVEGRSIEPRHVEELVYREGPRVVAKADGSAQGRDVTVFQQGRDDILRLAGTGDFVIQRFVTQAPFLHRFNPANVATLRVTTVKVGTEPAAVRAAYLRLGRSDTQTILAAANIRVPIMDDRGSLAELGASPDWERLPAHPDTGEAFAGAVIPAYEAVRLACESLHDRLPHVTVIGWDATIDDEGKAQILEWNCFHPGIIFSEMSTGPCFADLGWEKLREADADLP